MNELTQIIITYVAPISAAIYAIIRASFGISKVIKTKKAPSIEEITKFVIEAEKILGAGQGLAKKQWVQDHIKDKSKKTSKKIDNIVSVLNTENN